MGSVNLDECQPFEKPLDSTFTGKIEITVGGSVGDGEVDVQALPGGTTLTVSTGKVDDMNVTNATSLRFHYKADPAAPQSVDVNYVLL